MDTLRHLGCSYALLASIKAVWPSIIGALTGGLIASFTAWLVQKRDAEERRRNKEEDDARLVKNTLQAIAAELRILQKHNLNRLQKDLNDRANAKGSRKEGDTEDEPFAAGQIGPNVFTVFDASAGHLGRIRSDKLREQIIGVYGKARGLVGVLNHTSKEFDFYRSIDSPEDERKEKLRKDLELIEARLRKGLNEFQDEIGALLSEIEKY